MRHFILLPLSLIIFFASCRSVYKPNAVNVPLLKEKGEAKIYISDNNLQAAYAVSENTGVMLNGYYEKRTTTESNGDFVETRGILGEAGVGYFKTLENKLSLELYGGAGFGKLKIRERMTDENDVAIGKNVNANAWKLFVQPSVGYAGRIFEVAFTPRLTALKYSDLSVNNYTYQETRSYYFEHMDKTLWFFAEPAVTMRVGYKWFKVQIQAGRSFRLNSKPLENNANLLNAGVIIDIAKWYND